MLRLTLIILTILTVLLYSPFDTGSFTSTNGHSRILILTAHPDDECMFFAPTILGLNNTQKDVKVYALSLSVGNADHLGMTRRQEFHKSYDVLGVPPEQRWIVDHPKLQDNIAKTWSPTLISEVITPYVLDNHIDAILTFDYDGISQHPNHKSLPSGVVHLLRTFHAVGHPTPRLYALITVPLFAKYTSIFAPLLAKFDLTMARVMGYLINFAERETAIGTGLPVSKHDLDMNARGLPVFVSGIPEYVQALQAMRMHESQLVWFRWLYVSFSRYMWVNEWAEIRVH